MNDPYHVPIEPEPIDKWRGQALCAQIDSEIFFPDKGGSTKQAKRICGMCEVRLECLQAALDREERFGIWGGLSERERRALRPPKRPRTASRIRTHIPLAAGLAHGTRAAYNAGCKCRPCCAADGHYQRNRHTRRGNYGGAA